MKGKIDVKQGVNAVLSNIKSVKGYKKGLEL
jgi:hypothetical protein